MCSLLQMLLLFGTCFISYFAVHSHTHPLENNGISPPTHSLQNVDTYNHLSSSFGTSAVSNKLFLKKLPFAILSNNKPITYVLPYRLKSTSNINGKPDGESKPSSVTQITLVSLYLHPLINGNELSVQTSRRQSLNLSRYSVEDSHKLLPVFKSNSTLLQSYKTASDITGSPSGSESLVSNKVHKLQNISTRHSSRSLEATNLRLSSTARVKRSVGDAVPQGTTLAASSRTNNSNNAQDSEDIKDPKPTTVVTRGNGSSLVTESVPVNNKDGAVLVGLDQSNAEMPSKILMSGAVLRGFVVFVGCSVVVMVYIVLKFVCSRRQRRYSKVSRADDFNLLPLTEEGDDDEEIFSANRHS